MNASYYYYTTKALLLAVFHLTCCLLAADTIQEEDEEVAEDDAEEETEFADEVKEDSAEPEDTQELPSAVPEEPTMKIVSKKPAGGAAQGSPFNMSFFFPHIMYTYMEDIRRMVTIDFLVIGQSKEKYRPKVVSDGGVFQLGMVIPPMFVDENRLMRAFEHDTAFNEDTHQATALREIVGKHTGHLDIEENLMGTPMQIKLPFKCEMDIKEWEMIALDNDESFTKEVGLQQYYFILSVTLIGVEKVKQVKKAGGFRMLGTGSPGGDAMATEDE